MATFYLTGAEFANSTSFGLSDPKDPSSQLYASGGAQPFPDGAIIAIEVSGEGGDGGFGAGTEVVSIKVYDSVAAAESDAPTFTYGTGVGDAVDSADIVSMSDSAIGFDARELVSADKGAPVLETVGLFPGTAAVKTLAEGGEFYFDQRDAGGDGTFSTDKGSSLDDIKGDGGTKVVVHDFIQVNFATDVIADGGGTIASDQLVKVHDNIELTSLKDGSTFESGDTITIDGVVYTFEAFYTTNATFTTEHGEVASKAYILQFVDAGNNTVNFIGPDDGTDIPDILSIKLEGAEKDGGSLSYSSFDSNENVTIKSGGVTGIHDLTDGVDQGSIIGTAAGEAVWGGPGDGIANGGLVINDTINAGGGDDTIHAGDGNDYVLAGSGNDVADGSTGNDTIFGDVGNDTITGGDGADSLDGDAGSDSIDGGIGNDTLIGDDGDDTLIGGAGDDAIYASGGNNLVDAGTGKDEIYLGDGNDTVIADEALNSDPNEGDKINTGEGDDVIFAGGDDGVYAGEDLDELDIDKLYVEDVASITFTGTDVGEENESGQITFLDGSKLEFEDVEEIYVDGTLYTPATPGTKVVYDFVQLSGGLPTVNVTQTVANGDLVQLVEPLTFDMADATQLQTGDSTNIGGDIWTVSQIAETTSGGDFKLADGSTPANLNVHFVTLSNGGTQVTYLVPHDAEGNLVEITEFTLDSPVFVDSSIPIADIDSNNTVTLGAPGGIHDLTDGVDQGSVIGTIQDDVIWGGPADGLQDGGIVINDTISGGAGGDTIHAGNGDDEIYGEDGNDSVNAGSGNDTIEGGEGADTLNGQAGSDLINGGAGDDTMYGGSGNDTIGDWGGGSAPTNLIQNGSFEDGTHSANGVDGLDGWSNAGGSPDSADDGTSAESWNPALDAYEGTGYITMWSGNSGPGEAMTQTLAAPLTAGETYTVSLQASTGEYTGGQWFNPSAIDVEFEILDSSTNTVIGSVTVNGTDYEHYSFNITPTTNVSQITIRPNTTGAGNNPSITLDNFGIYLGADIDPAGGLAEPGDDYIDGEAGDDVLNGGTGEDTVIGGTGDDTIYADSDDQIDGSEDGDELDVDVLYVSDVASVQYTGTDVGEEHETGIITFNDGSTMDFANIEKLFTDGTQITGPDSGGPGDTSTTDVTVYDLIQLSGGLPGANETLTVGDGDLVQVIEPVVFSVTGNQIDAGDTATIGGVQYTVTTVHTDDTAVVTYDNGTSVTPGSIEMGYITLTPTAGGAPITYMVPIESPSVNLPNITQIEQGDAPGITGSIPVDEVNGNENVTLGGGNITVTDIIITSLPGAGGAGGLPVLNDVLVAGSELVSVVETATVQNGGSGNSVNEIESGDTFVLNGTSYLVDDIQEVHATVQHEDSSGNPVTSTNVEIHNVTLYDAATNTFLTVAIPTDGDALENISSITITTVDGYGDEIIDTEVDDDDVVSLEVPTPADVTIHDAIIFSGSSLNANGQTTTTLAGDMTSVVDGITLDSANGTHVALGDTITIDGVEWTIDAMQVINTDVTHDDNNFGTQVSNIDMLQLQLSDGGGGTLIVGIPGDGTPNGDLPDITQIEFNAVSTTNVPQSISAIDDNEVVTLATEQQVVINDAIQLSGNIPALNATQTTLGGDLVEVDDGIIVTSQATPNFLTVGDTVEIGGVEYTVGATSQFEGEFVHDDEYGIPETSTVEGYTVSLTPSGGGATINVMVPFDGEGDLPEIQEITVTSYSGANTPIEIQNTTNEDVDNDDFVTLAGYDEDNTAVFDLIAIEGFNPTNNGMLATDAGAATNGELVSVADSLQFELADPTLLANGDTTVIGGVTWTVTSIYEGATGTVSHDDPATGLPTTTADVELIGIMLSDGNGGTMTFVAPVDSEGDLPQITQIDYTGVGAGGVTTQTDVANLDANDIVTLESAETPPIYDAIIMSDLPEAGDMFLSGTQLTAVTEPLVFNVSQDGQIEPGATFTYGGQTYQVTYTEQTQMGVLQSDGSNTVINGALIQGETADGQTLQFTIPADDAGDLPNIVAISYATVGVTGTLDVPIGTIDDNDDVALADLPALHDLIELSQPFAPGVGDTLDTGSSNGNIADLVEVDEPVTYLPTTPGLVSEGDTFVINGEIYTLTDVTGTNMDITYNGGSTTATGINGRILTLESGSGDTLVYTVPSDVEGNFPDITSITYTSTNPGMTNFNLTVADDDDIVTLDDPDADDVPGAMHDFILLGNSQPSDNDVLNTADGDLVAVIEPMVFNLATAGQLSESDTVEIGGVTYEIVQINVGVSGDYTFDPTAAYPTGEATLDSTLIYLEGPGGEELTYLVPNDTNGDVPQITSVTLTTTGGDVTSIPSTILDGNDVVTLGGTFETVVYDGIELGDTPLLNEIFTSTGVGGASNGTLVEMDEPLVFNATTPGEISLGDTVVINGEVFTVTATDQWAGNVTHTDPVTSGSTVTAVKGALLTLTGPNGLTTIDYAIPYDDFGDLPEITQIEFTQLDNTVNPDLDLSDVDDNDFVTLICFGRDTRITTPRGEIAVQDLAEGDLVLTRDAGFQPIRWVGATKVEGKGAFAPITIKAGALGNTRDLRVSPQHRMLLSDWRAEVMFGEHEVLAAAKHLTNGDTIFVEPMAEVEYFHILFDEHQIVYAEGCASESFHPGAGGVAGLAEETRAELFALFPELRRDMAAYGPAARVTLKGGEAHSLMAELSFPMDQAWAAE